MGSVMVERVADGLTILVALFAAAFVLAFIVVGRIHHRLDELETKLDRSTKKENP